MKKTVLIRMISLCIVLAIALGASAGVLAAYENHDIEAACENFQDAENNDAKGSVRAAIFGSLNEAKTYYGYNWNYVCKGYNYTYGYYMYYFTMTDGTVVNFNCYQAT